MVCSFQLIKKQSIFTLCFWRSKWFEIHLHFIQPCNLSWGHAIRSSFLLFGIENPPFGLPKLIHSLSYLVLQMKIYNIPLCHISTGFVICSWNLIITLPTGDKCKVLRNIKLNGFLHQKNSAFINIRVRKSYSRL